MSTSIAITFANHFFQGGGALRANGGCPGCCKSDRHGGPSRWDKVFLPCNPYELSCSPFLIMVPVHLLVIFSCSPCAACSWSTWSSLPAFVIAELNTGLVGIEHPDVQLVLKSSSLYWMLLTLGGCLIPIPIQIIDIIYWWWCWILHRCGLHRVSQQFDTWGEKPEAWSQRALKVWTFHLADFKISRIFHLADFNF